MKITVVIPTYNRARTIADAVLSTWLQTHKPDEIIVVDDGSTDNTADVVSALDIPILRYIRQQNQGGNAARNRGISEASGNWIAFQDSDDLWMPCKLARLVGAHRECGLDAPQAIFSSFIVFDPARNAAYSMPACMRNFQSPGAHILRDPLKQTNLLCQNIISTQTLLAKRSLLQEIGMFDVSLKRFQDWDLAIKLAEVTPLLYVAEPLVNVTLSSDSITRIFRAGIDARAVLLEKHIHSYGRFPIRYARAKIDYYIRKVLGFLWS